MARLPTLALAAALAASLSAPGHAEITDRGSFTLYVHDRALGAETFEVDESRDSLVFRARLYLMVPGSSGDETLEKGADILVGRTDYGLRHYQSNLTFRGATTIRALVVHDTHYVAYREREQGGVGESRVLPPGRLYVMDSEVMSLFDVICRSLRGQTFESRTLNLLALGPRDTLLEARAVALGRETIRWGGRPVQARKLDLVADHQTTFTLWAGSRGELLRMVEPNSGLRAERSPPPVKRRPPKPGS